MENHGLVLVRFNDMPDCHIINLSGDNAHAEEDAARIVESFDGLMGNPLQSLFMIFDAMVPNITTLIDNIYFRSGDAVHYMGVNAGSETFQPVPCLFNSDIFVGNAVLAMLMQNHPGAVLEHGYQEPDSSISATSTTGNRINTIDWRPAFDVYRELARECYGLEVTPENFYESAVHFPLGIMRMDGEILVRIPVALESDGSIFCVGEVPEHAVLTLLKAFSPDSRKTLEILMQHADQKRKPGMLLFYCAGRRMHMGAAALEELTYLQQMHSGQTNFGALSLGEIGGSRQAGYPLFHNAALVNIPWD